MDDLATNTSANTAESVRSCLQALLSSSKDDLVLHAKRVDMVKRRMRPGSTLSDVWNLEHHVHVAGSVNVFEKVFSAMQVDKLAIIFGHKKQGKSQLLFFLMKLLQSLGEPVVYLDNSIEG